MARLPAAGFRHVAQGCRAARGTAERPRGTAREARARHLGRDRPRELRGDDRVRHACGARDRRGGRRSLRVGGYQGRGVRRGARVSPSLARASRAPRRTSRRRGRGGARGRPQPAGGGVRLLATGPGGQSGRRALPGPPDQHEAQASGGRVRFRRGRRRCVVGGVRARGRELHRLVSRLLRAQPRRRDAAVPDRSGRAESRPGARSRDRHVRAGRRPRPVRAGPVPPRHRRAGRRGCDGRLPVAQRERGVRDRVLAARALQARAGTAARRARRPGGIDHRRRERHRPRNRAHARLAWRACRRRRPEPRRRPGRRVAARLGVRRASGARGRGRRHE